MTRYIYCPIQDTIVPYGEQKIVMSPKQYFIQDEMEPTRNPLNPKEIYTSKSKLRAAYRAAGAIEIGDAYERGYNPENSHRERESRLVNNIKEQIAQRLQYGRK